MLKLTVDGMLILDEPDDLVAIRGRNEVNGHPAIIARRVRS